MPAIWFGTVVLWEEVEHEKQKRGKKKTDQKQTDVAEYKRVKHTDIKNIRVYVHGDIDSQEAKPRIVEEYINKEKNGDLKLWEAFAKGLLQVYDIEPTIVTPPLISEDDE
jgi:hypothetical protein